MKFRNDIPIHKIFIYRQLKIKNFTYDQQIMTFSQQPSVEEISKWNSMQVIKFLETKKDELLLDEDHIKIIKNQEITGPAFLLLTIEELKSYGLKGGPSMIIAKLVKELKSEEQAISFQEVQKLIETL
jgi:hypothetical protein